MKKIKKYLEKIKNFLKNTKIILKDNPLFTWFIIGSVINGTLLRFLTVKNYFGISPIISDLFVSLLFGGLYFCIKEKNRFKYIFTLSIIFSIIGVANIVYYHYYNSFISVTFISFALTNTETGGANVVGNLLNIEFFILLWFPIFMFFYNKHLKNKNIKIKDYDKKERKKVLKLVYFWFLFFFLLFLTTLDLVDYGRFYNQWNREYSVTKFGVYLYQLNDVIVSIEPKVAPLFGSDKAKKEISEYYEELDKKQSINEYTGIFEGKNIIAIHAESIQTLAMEQEFNGIPVTPNLNYLASEGIYFSNFYSQVSIGTSSDTEYLVATSFMPVKSGTAFVNYSDKTYPSMYKILKENGYYTFSMHANTGEFWNRNNMYKSLGYDNFYERNSYTIEETIGFGLSDKSFFTQAADIIEEISNTNGKFYGTIITLSNHTPFEDIDSYGYFDVSMMVDGVTYPYLEGTKLGNYFKSVHYADKQIGMFIDLLDEKGLLEDTIIIIYGDHDARISKSEWEYYYNYDYLNNTILDENDPNYKKIDYYWYEVNRRTPFIIWSKDDEFKEKYKKEITKVSGMIDISPTILNMLGLYNEYALGEDLFANFEEENIVAFPNGNFITDKVYYNDSKNEYKLLQDVPLEEDYIKKCKSYTEKILNISNNIAVYNYFETELSKDKYIDETRIGEK